MKRSQEIASGAVEVLSKGAADELLSPNLSQID
jgi:hypothetical protein